MRAPMLILTCTLATTGTAWAATLDVCPTGCTFASIQDAIDASSDGDVIEIAAGTYHEHDLSPQQKAITIRGATDLDGMPATTIDSLGLGDNIMAFFAEGNDTIIEHLVFTGVAGGGWAAVTMFHARPTMINCTFVGNETTGIGGGVYNLNGAPIFIDCRFIDNTANWGGGYACWETGQPDHPSFLRCTFSGNTAALGGAFSNLRSSPVAGRSVSSIGTYVATENVAARSSTKATIAANAGSATSSWKSCRVRAGTRQADSGGAICNSTLRDDHASTAAPIRRQCGRARRQRHRQQPGRPWRS